MDVNTRIQHEAKHHAEVQQGEIMAVVTEARDVLHPPVDAEDPYRLDQYVQRHHQEHRTKELLLQGNGLKKTARIPGLQNYASTRDAHIPVQAFLQGDEGFSAFDPADLLQLVVQDIP